MVRSKRKMGDAPVEEHWAKRIRTAIPPGEAKVGGAWIDWDQIGVPPGWEIRFDPRTGKASYRNPDGVEFSALRQIFAKPPKFKKLEKSEYVNVKIAADRAQCCECDLAIGETCSVRDECLNRTMKIECPKNCRCGLMCQNQRLRKRERVQHEIKFMGKKGWGFVTKENIKPGQLIGEYCGEVINAEEKHRRLQEDYTGNRNFYLLDLGNGLSIDATRKGTHTRFVNHSCEPNAITEKWTVDGKMRVGIFAKKFIHAGCEVTFDYKFERAGKDLQECYCGKPSCRGFLGAKRTKPELEEESFNTFEGKSGYQSSDNDNSTPRKNLQDQNQRFWDSTQKILLDKDIVNAVTSLQALARDSNTYDNDQGIESFQATHGDLTDASEETEMDEEKDSKPVFLKRNAKKVKLMLCMKYKNEFGDGPKRLLDSLKDKDRHGYVYTLPETHKMSEDDFAYNLYNGGETTLASSPPRPLPGTLGYTRLNKKEIEKIIREKLTKLLGEKISWKKLRNGMHKLNNWPLKDAEGRPVYPKMRLSEISGSDMRRILDALETIRLVGGKSTKKRSKSSRPRAAPGHQSQPPKTEDTHVSVH